MENQRVVIIDDSPKWQVNLRDITNRAGLEVIGTATSVKEGIAAINRLNPEVLLLDLHLAGIGPRESGIQILRELANRHTQLKIFVVTGEPSSQLREACSRLGAYLFFDKVMELDQLQSALSSVGAEHSSLQAQTPSRSDPDQAEADDTETSTVKALRVLIVEDNSIDVMVLKRSLKKAGVLTEPIVVDNADQAIAFLDQQPPFDAAILPELIILDLNLSQSSGLTVLDHVRSNPKLAGLPIAIHSSSPEDAMRSRQHQADWYFKKTESLHDYMSVGKHILQAYLLFTPAQTLANE